MISVTTKGDFKKFNKFVKHMSRRDYLKIVEKYARLGVEALSEATPIDTGETASKWNYEIYTTKRSTKIIWTNDNVTRDGTPIPILLQFGHATKDGGFVEGIDFINPAMAPVFDKLLEQVWKEVTSY